MEAFSYKASMLFATVTAMSLKGYLGFPSYSHRNRSWEQLRMSP